MAKFDLKKLKKELEAKGIKGKLVGEKSELLSIDYKSHIGDLSTIEQVIIAVAKQGGYKQAKATFSGVTLGKNEIVNITTVKGRDIGLMYTDLMAGAKSKQNMDITPVSMSNFGSKKEELPESKEFTTYKAWKGAVKKLDKKATFTGDKDIDGAFKKGWYDAEWDGDSGEIRPMNAEAFSKMSCCDDSTSTTFGTSMLLITDADKQHIPSLGKLIDTMLLKGVGKDTIGVIATPEQKIDLEAILRALPTATLQAYYKLAKNLEERDSVLWSIRNKTKMILEEQLFLTAPETSSQAEDEENKEAFNYEAILSDKTNYTAVKDSVTDLSKQELQEIFKKTALATKEYYNLHTLHREVKERLESIILTDGASTQSEEETVDSAVDVETKTKEESKPATFTVDYTPWLRTREGGHLDYDFITEGVKKLPVQEAKELYAKALKDEFKQDVMYQLRSELKKYLEEKILLEGVTSEQATPKDRVADTILQQMGGANKLSAMIGAGTFLAHSDGLSFKFKGKKANYVKLTLDTKKDLYNMDYKKIRGMGVKDIKVVSGLDFTQIQANFKTVTGMDIKL